MLTPAEFLDIIKLRNLSLVSVRVKGEVRWQAKTIDNSRATGSNQLFLTPEEAIEAADLHLKQSEQREVEQSTSQTQVVLALSKGDFYIRSRRSPDLDNPGSFLIQYDGVFSGSNEVSPRVRDRVSFIQAVLDMEKEASNESSSGRNSR